VAKGSLYNTFGSKEELVRAYLEHRHAAVTGFILRFLELYTTPADRLLGVFEAERALVSRPAYRGCAFVNASAEASPGSVVVQVSDTFRAWIRALFTDLAEQAGVPDPPALAARMQLLFDGAAVSTGMDRDASATEAAKTIAALLLDEALRPANP
jgi:AcrR family transcriptional regulator